MRARFQSGLSVSIAAGLGTAGVIVLTGAVSHHPPPPLGPTVEVSLIRQDQSDCTNANVNANDPSLIGGTAWVVRQPNGTTSVKVGITAKPNTKYQFFLKCVKQLGDITTQDEGEAVGLFEFPTDAVGSVYGFDMYPEGAPSGNKYQSIQVKFQ
jgi:hypothetical protein